jgi:hypothetical protein
VRWISVHDVARFAIAAQRGQFDGKTVQLGGPDPLSLLDIVRIFEDLGTHLNCEFVPISALEAQLHSTADPVAQSLMAVSLLLASGQLRDTESGANLLAGRMTTVRDYAIRLLRK